MNKILKLTLILLLVCAVTAGVLGAVNEITKDRIAEIEAMKTKEAYAAVLPADDYIEIEFDKSKPEFKNIDTIAAAADGSGWVVKTTFSGAQGNITMAVGISSEKTCTGISIIEHSETSGLGANAASPAEVGVKFRAQFVGADENVALKKSGGEIDALSGATITSDSVTTAVANAIRAVIAIG